MYIIRKLAGLFNFLFLLIVLNKNAENYVLNNFFFLKFFLVLGIVWLTLASALCRFFRFLSAAF